MDFSAAWVVLIGAHAAKPSHAGVRFHAFTMRASGWPSVAIIHRWSEAVRSHPRQSTGPNVGQRDALLSILATDALAAAQRDRDRDLRPMVSAGMAGGLAGAGRPLCGWLWFFGKGRRWSGRDRAPRSQRRCGMVVVLPGSICTTVGVPDSDPGDQVARLRPPITSRRHSRKRRTWRRGGPHDGDGGCASARAAQRGAAARYEETLTPDGPVLAAGRETAS